MELNEYQDRAMSTCMPSCNNISYMLLNLVAEVGEFSGKLAKAIRKEQVAIGGLSPTNKNKLTIPSFPPEIDFDVLAFDKELQKEAGDILWQFAGVCSVMGWRLEKMVSVTLKSWQIVSKEALLMVTVIIDSYGNNQV